MINRYPRYDIPVKTIHAKHWVDAVIATFQGDYQSAMTSLDYVDKSFGRKKIRYHLLRGFVCFYLKRNIAAVESFESAIKLLKYSNGFNKDEKKYILSFATIFGNKALEASNITQEYKLFPQTDIASVNLSSVRQYLKHNFPLKEHPDWPQKL